MHIHASVTRESLKHRRRLRRTALDGPASNQYGLTNRQGTHYKKAPIGVLQRTQEKEDLGSDGGLGVNFTDNFKNGKCHKVRTHNVVNVSLLG